MGVGGLSGRSPTPDPRPRHSPVLDLDVRPGGVHQFLPIPFGLEVHHLGLEAGAGGRQRSGRDWGSSAGHWDLGCPPRGGRDPWMQCLGHPPTPETPRSY